MNIRLLSVDRMYCDDAINRRTHCAMRYELPIHIVIHHIKKMIRTRG
jgi:hypothetical protein